MEFNVKGAVLTVQVARSIYNIDVLHKCFYWYGADFDVTIGELDEKHYVVELICNEPEHDFAESISKIKRDIVDFKLRDTVTKETHAIRDLIAAKAFAYYDDDNHPTTELSDPVGFDPLTI